RHATHWTKAKFVERIGTSSTCLGRRPSALYASGASGNRLGQQFNLRFLDSVFGHCTSDSAALTSGSEDKIVRGQRDLTTHDEVIVGAEADRTFVRGRIEGRNRQSVEVVDAHRRNVDVINAQILTS